MHEVITKVVDDGDFFEIQPTVLEFSSPAKSSVSSFPFLQFAKNIVVGFSRFEGKTVGIVANQPKELAGVLDIDASNKAARYSQSRSMLGLLFLILPY